MIRCAVFWLCMVASGTAAFAGHIKALVRMNIFKLLPKALTNRSESIARDIFCDGRLCSF